MTLPLVIGRGKFYVNGTFLGNCSQVRFAPKIEVARYNDYSTGIRRTGKIRVASKGFTGSFITDYITSANLSLYLNGALLASVVFAGNNPVSGPDVLYTFTSVAILPGGEEELIGDSWQVLPFNFEGTMYDPTVSAVGGTWTGGVWQQEQTQWSTTTTVSTSSTTTTA
jgi:hypothetical protein